MEVMVKRVKEAFDQLQPVFSRKVKFLELMIVKGEGYVELANRMNQVSELRNLDEVLSRAEQDGQVVRQADGNGPKILVKGSKNNKEMCPKPSPQS